jgi:hypothetical protein
MYSDDSTREVLPDTAPDDFGVVRDGQTIHMFPVGIPEGRRDHRAPGRARVGPRDRTAVAISGFIAGFLLGSFLIAVITS